MKQIVTGKSLVLFHTELDTINLFSEQMRASFLQMGYEIFDFDTSDTAKSLGLLYEYQKTHVVTAMIAFNSRVFGAKTKSGVNIWETLQIPSVNILLDHPYWYYEILKETPRNGAVLCVDRNHMQYVNRFFPHIAVNGFLPHGGTVLGELRPIAERSIDVLYAGSLYAYDADNVRRSITGFRFDASKICDEVIEILMADPSQTIEATIEQVMLQKGIELSDEELLAFFSRSVYIERVIGSYYREKIVSSIAKSGVPLTIFGRGWEQCDFVRRDNVQYGGLISAKEALAKVRDCKILLNSMPWFKDGSHERVFNGMLNGAVVATDDSDYFLETIPYDDYIHLDLTDVCVGEKISETLTKQERLRETAENAYKYAIKEHTWAHRANELHRDLLQFL